MKKNYEQVIEAIINNKDVLKATKYVSPKLIVRGVRKSYKFNGRKPLAYQNLEITLTIGRPNYVERDFIELCQKAKEPFPVKKVQLKVWNPAKKNLKRNGR